MASEERTDTTDKPKENPGSDRSCSPPVGTESGFLPSPTWGILPP